MPHLIVEHSGNVPGVQAIVEALHDAALDSGVAALDALRTRALPCSHWAIADRDPSNLFVAVTVRLARGRSEEDKQRLLLALMDSLERALGPAAEAAMLSVECQDIDPACRINRNHLRTRVAERNVRATPDR